MKKNPIINKNIVTSDQIDRNNKNNIIMDDDDNYDNPVNLPDVGKILSEVMKILEYMTTDEMIDMKSQDLAAYEEQMESKFPEFADKYYAVFKKVISGEDITPLFKMLVGIDKVNRGEKTIEEVETNLGKELANKYVLPVINKNKKK